jgi:hypothetical protein
VASGFAKLASCGAKFNRYRCDAVRTMPDDIEHRA